MMLLQPSAYCHAGKKTVRVLYQELFSYFGNKKPSHRLGLMDYATERVGFEPTVPLQARWFSRPEP